MQIIRKMSDGLLLRSATGADTDRLVAFHADVHRPPNFDEPATWVGALVRDLLERPHPTLIPSDFTVVEEMQTGRIVSSLCLVPQTWTYAGIPFGVGRPELVGTDPEFRRRGLVRAQMEVVHDWSTERGHLMQAITGIPWYYRQFGYEMAMDLGGGRSGYQPQVPKLKAGKSEPYRIRPASEADLGFISQVYDHAARRSLVTCVRDAAMWRYELSGRSQASANRAELAVVEELDGDSVGFLVWSVELWRNRVTLHQYELGPGANWLDVSPCVVRFLWAAGLERAEQDSKAELAEFALMLGTNHPAIQAMHGLLPRVFKPYAWYVRVPDLAKFIRHIAPSLNERLAASVLPNHSGELKISFYRAGLRLVFVAGQLAETKPWTPMPGDEGHAAFPSLVFYQLLLGHRTLDDLMYAFPDCWASDDARVLLDVLWPRMTSSVWPVA